MVPLQCILIWNILRYGVCDTTILAWQLQIGECEFNILAWQLQIGECEFSGARRMEQEDNWYSKGLMYVSLLCCSTHCKLEGKHNVTHGHVCPTFFSFPP